MLAIFGISKNKLANVRRNDHLVYRERKARDVPKKIPVQGFLKVQKMLADVQPDKAEVHLPYTQKKSLWEQYDIQSSKPGT